MSDIRPINTAKFYSNNILNLIFKIFFNVNIRFFSFNEDIKLIWSDSKNMYYITEDFCFK